jgi:hypothetical protein
MHLKIGARSARMRGGANTHPFSSESSMRLNEKFKENFTWDKERSSEAAMCGGGGGQRRVLCVNEPRKADAFSARARCAAKAQ